MEKIISILKFVRSSPAGTVTHDDILDITEAIAEDGRYKALDRMDADRKLLLFQVGGAVPFYSSQGSGSSPFSGSVGILCLTLIIR